MAKFRVLITGAAGQVGSYVYESMAASFDCVAAFSPRVQSATLTIDLADENDIHNKVRQIKPDIIINAGAYTAVDKAESEQELAHKINAVAPGILAKEAHACKALLIHYSTDYVFSGTGAKPWQEVDPTNPNNVYGATKLAGEQAIAEFHNRYFIFRTSWVVSPRGHNFIKTMLKLGREREELKVVCDQWGAPASAQSLASHTEAICQMAHQNGADWSEDRTGLYHLTSSGETTWHGLAAFSFAYAKECGAELRIKDLLPISTAEYPTPALRPANSRLDCQKFSSTFHLQRQSWQDAVRSIIDQLL